jgi:hypothetical protein
MDPPDAPAVSRSVWLFARPLSLAYMFAPAALTSASSLPLCHWGVLVTRLEENVVKHHLYEINRTDSSGLEQELGVMWELHRVEGKVSTTNMTSPLKVRHIQHDWYMFSAQMLGETTWEIENIQEEGTTIGWLADTF